MTNELSEEGRERVGEVAKAFAQVAREEGRPLWMVREVLVAAFDAEAERVEK